MKHFLATIFDAFDWVKDAELNGLRELRRGFYNDTEGYGVVKDPTGVYVFIREPTDTGYVEAKFKLRRG